MKKRLYLILLLVVCAAMVLTVLPQPAAADKITCISVNDLLPPELVNAVTYYGGVAYVPYSVFSAYGLGIAYSFFSSASTAYFYTGAADLFFDIPNGRSYDADDYQYSAAAILYGGTVYVPLSFTAGYFGVSVSYITDSEYGTIVRLTNGTQVLTDSEFLTAASHFMENYSQRFNTPEPTATAEPATSDAPSPTPEPTPSPSATPQVNHENDTLSLCFLGLPDARVIDVLSRRELTATAFVTARDVRERADDVRRLVCTGWSVGVCCAQDGAVDYEEVTQLLFDAARIRTVLVSAPPDNAAACRAAAQRRGLVYAEAELDVDALAGGEVGLFVVTQLLDEGGDRSLLLNGSDAQLNTLDQLLRYIQDAGFSTARLRETA